MDEKAKKTGGLIAALGVAWFWFSQATSVIGLIGIIEDLKAWASFADWLMQQLNAFAPALIQAVDAIGAFIHAGLELFRSTVRPVFDFLLGWAPFDVPQVVKDAAVVVVFAALGTLRVGARNRQGWRDLTDKELTEMRDRARTFGLEIADQNYRRGGAADLQRGVSDFWYLRGVPIEITDQSLRQTFEENVATAVTLFGSRFREFAELNPTTNSVSPHAMRLFGNEKRGLIFVYSLAAITIVAVAIDFFLFK